jgi:Flp pilus assembly protein TadD
LAIAQYHLNKEKEALETLAEAVKLDPKNPISLTNMGFIYDEMEDPNNALKFIK